ncbi:MAG TPA: cytochrome c oxidase assembly protein [Gemmatimonadaceae bacterium]|nr:cytochrome c oxidase assembly protein [Gemmatimonadaceae bacterium]
MKRSGSGCAIAALCIGAALPRAAWAHTGRAPEPHDLWTSWTFAPAVIVGLVLAAWWYARGVRALWRHAAPGRGIARWRAACFAAGVLTVAIALVSPIDALGSALFAAHMTQHMLLVVVAAPLLVLGDPGTASLWTLPIGARRRVGLWWRRARLLPAIWRALRWPLVAWTLHVGALWLWHLPSLYDAALRDEGVHIAEHASFFLTALLFWYPLADPHPGRRFGVGVATLYLFAAGLQCTMLGALMSFARRPWYVAHYGTTQPWGLSPLEDQQLAGLIMWIPAGLVYLIALLPTVLPVLRTPAPQWVASPTVAGVSARGTP